MITKIFIANRGEIAYRIIKTATNLHIKTVVVGSECDRDSLWYKNADTTILMSEESINEIYYSPIRILSLARLHHCDAIHPGYGFLSENPELALLCENENIAFIGPTAEHIQLMGNKKLARNFVKRIGLPVPYAIEGTIDEILGQKDKLVFPAIIKSVAGGGGHGMFIVESLNDLKEKLIQASAEAEKWFGQSGVYIEQYIDDARHIEIQIMADRYGNALHLFDRECSLQRKYQKIIEEAPSPSITEEQRIELCRAALKIVIESGYYSLGTIEFLFKNGQFWFLEMNTRIQVEHPVTELITGIDLIEQQIQIANHFELQIRQKDVKILGHAIEARLYAENPDNQFKPSAGHLHYIHIPDMMNVRVDTAFESSGFISPHFDGLIAKVISFSNDRISALNNLKSTLNQLAYHGVDTNQTFLSSLIASNDFIENKISTAYIDKNMPALIQNMKSDTPIEIILASVIYKENYRKTEDPVNLWHQIGPFVEVKLSEYIIERQIYKVAHVFNKHELSIEINNQKVTIKIVQSDCHHFILHLNEVPFSVIISEGNTDYWVQSGNSVQLVKSQQKLKMAVLTKKHADDNLPQVQVIKSPLYGTISRILTTTGQIVKQGQLLLVIESMKTENELLSPVNGIVAEICVNEKNQVKEGETLVTFQYN